MWEEGLVLKPLSRKLNEQNSKADTQVLSLGPVLLVVIVSEIGYKEEEERR